MVRDMDVCTLSVYAWMASITRFLLLGDHERNGKLRMGAAERTDRKVSEFQV